MTKSGLQLRYTLPVWGRLASLGAAQIFLKSTKSIVFTVEEGTAHVIHYCNNDFVNFYSISFDNTTQTRRSELGHYITSDPQSGTIAIHVYHGFVRILVLSPAARKKIPKGSRIEFVENWFDIQIEFACVTSINFLEIDETHLKEFPVLGVVCGPQDGESKLIAYALNLKTASTEHSTVQGCTFSNSMAILLPPPLRGYLLVCSESATWFEVNIESSDVILFDQAARKRKDPEGPNISPKLEIRPSTQFRPGRVLEEFTTYAIIDSTRILAVCDDGSLYLIMLLCQSDGVLEDVRYELVGYTSPATGLIHISGNLFFVSSHYGPSALFELNTAKLSIRIIQEFDNLGPILDIALSNRDPKVPTDLEIFTCSGGYRNGSVKKISPGRALETLAQARIPAGVTQIWFDNFSSTLIASRPLDTVTLYPANKPPQHPIMLDTSRKTLSFYGNNLYHIQVTSQAILLFHNNERKATIENGILRASISDDYVAVCLASNKVEVYTHALVKIYEKQISYPIAAIACFGELIAVSTWDASLWLMITKVSTLEEYIFPQNDLKDECSPAISLMIARSPEVNSILLYVGCINRAIRIYSYDTSWSLVNHILGEGLTSSFVYTGKSVIAISDRPCELFISKEVFESSLGEVTCTLKISKMSINTDDVIMAGCMGKYESLNQYGSLFTVTSTNKLMVSKSELLFQNALRQKPLNNLTRRIALSFDNKYLLAANVVEAKNGDRKFFSSSLTLFSGTTLQEVQPQNMVIKQEEGVIIECILPIPSKTDSYWFAVGASKMGDKDFSGIISTAQVRHAQLTFIQSLKTPGGVFDMVYSEGTLVASVGGAIHFYDVLDTGRLDEKDDKKVPLCPTIGVSMSARGSKLAVGDLMRGIFTFDMNHPKFGKIDGGYAPMANRGPYDEWVSCIEALPEDILLISDTKGNLFGHFEVTSCKDDMRIHVGDTINCIRRVDSHAKLPCSSGDDEADLYPLAVMGTVSGGLYMLFEINSEVTRDLSQLLYLLTTQATTALNRYQKKDPMVGYLKYKNPVNILDGDILSRFLKLSNKQQDIILGKLKGPLDISMLRRYLNRFRTIG